MAKIMELQFELLQHLPYLPYLAPSDYFFISKLEKLAQWRTIHVKRGSHRPNRCLFYGPSKILHFRRPKKVGQTLGKVYRVKERLCSKIKKIYPK